MVNPIYRARQFWQAMLPPMHTVDAGIARRVLTSPQMQLFEAMDKRDQRHALAVAGRLLAQGAGRPDLLAAALLHDCAKQDVPVWLRVANVMAPTLLARLAKRQTPGWRVAADRLLRHEELSASLAEAAGSSSLTMQLIRGSAPPEHEGLLKLLKQADDAS